MKPTEAAALLTICAAYDNRKPDVDAAKAWAMALAGHRFEDCREAIVNYYRASRDWIMPADVIKEVNRIRWARIVAFDSVTHLEPPAWLADDPAGEIQWFSRIRQLVADGEVTHPDQVDERGDLKPRDLTSLGQVGREVPRQ